MGSGELSATGNTDKKAEAPRLSWCWLLIVGVIVLWLAAWYLTTVFIQSPQERGTFGDMFGSVNSLFAGLAFAGLLFAIFLQRKELELQRQELQEARVQYRRQADQLEAPARTISKQRFEDTFFRMLDILKKQVGEVTTHCNASSGEVTGYDALACIYSEFKETYDQFHEEREPSGHSREQNALTLILQQHPQLLNYFGTLVHTLSLLEKSDIRDKIFYGTFLSAQLQRHEKLLLFYYALCPEFGDTKRRVENYSVLYGIDKAGLIEPLDANDYDAKAWEPRNEAD